MHDVFLSYAREDLAVAQKIAKGLQQAGLSVWWDRRLEAGQNFHVVLQQAIDQSKCVVVLWSTHSVESEWVLNEAAHGADQSALIPIMLHPVRIPIAFRSKHTISWSEGHVQALDQIVRGVKQVANKQQDPPHAVGPESTDKLHEATQTASQKKPAILSVESILYIGSVIVVLFALNPSEAAHQKKFAESRKDSLLSAQFLNIGKAERELNYMSFGVASVMTLKSKSIAASNSTYYSTKSTRVTFGVCGLVFAL